MVNPSLHLRFTKYLSLLKLEHANSITTALHCASKVTKKQEENKCIEFSTAKAQRKLDKKKSLFCFSRAQKKSSYTGNGREI